MTDILNYFLDLIIAILILFFIPLIYFGQKQDALMQTLVSTETSSFTNEVKSNGYITRDNYELFLEKLSKTGLLYDVKIDHKQLLQEPEYRLRTAQEVMEEQNSAFQGSNVYTFRNVTTEIPDVIDPVNTGTLNTETNESIMSSASNTPASTSHVHTSACYVGHKHTGTAESGGGCFSTPIYHTHTASCYSSVKSVHHHASGCYVTRYEVCGGTINYYYSTTMMHGGKIQDQVDIYYGVCSSCGATGNAYTSYYKNVCKTGTHATEGGTTTCSNMVNKQYLICGKVDGQYYTETYLSCNKTEGVSIDSYVLGCGLIEDLNLDCDKIISSISPTHPLQTVALGDPLITTATATYLNGSTQVVVGSSSFSTNVPLQNSVVTITYNYRIDGILFSRSCYINVTVVPRSKNCVRGHTYNLNLDGSDPGCPYCKAWLASLIITCPSSGNLTIYKGTTLPENGVTLTATYLDGHTELITNQYLDNLDNDFVGTQNVIITYKGKYVYLTVITKRNLTQCSVCNRYYELYPDGSDPGCPFCKARTPVFTGNIVEYNNQKFIYDITKELYEGKGIYYFSDKDYIEIQVKNNNRSWGSNLLAFIFKGLWENDIQVVRTGNIREAGEP